MAKKTASKAAPKGARKPIKGSAKARKARRPSASKPGPDTAAFQSTGPEAAAPAVAAPEATTPGAAAPGATAPEAAPAEAAVPEATAPEATANVLDRLWSVVLQRRDADPATSHSARLLSRGTAKVAQKFGEEAVECLIEAVAGNPAALIGESADVLYHLLVMWVAVGVEPAQVWAELQRREGVSGIAEKAARPKVLAGTTKIP